MTTLNDAVSFASLKRQSRLLSLRSSDKVDYLRYRSSNFVGFEPQSIVLCHLLTSYHSFNLKFLNTISNTIMANIKQIQLYYTFSQNNTTQQFRYPLYHISHKLRSAHLDKKRGMTNDSQAPLSFICLCGYLSHGSGDGLCFRNLALEICHAVFIARMSAQQFLNLAVA